MSQTLWPGKCDPQAPLIVIGAGRSGSSVLARVLGAHPDICFDDENDYFAVKLWHLVWENRRPRPVGATPPVNKEERECLLQDWLAPRVAGALVTLLGI